MIWGCITWWMMGRPMGHTAQSVWKCVTVTALSPKTSATTRRTTRRREIGAVTAWMHNLKRHSHFPGGDHAPPRASSVRAQVSASSQPQAPSSQTSPRPKGVVIGGGWAGLGAAYAMTQAGMDVTVRQTRVRGAAPP